MDDTHEDVRDDEDERREQPAVEVVVGLGDHERHQEHQARAHQVQDGEQPFRREEAVRDHPDEERRDHLLTAEESLLRAQESVLRAQESVLRAQESVLRAD